MSRSLLSPIPPRSWEGIVGPQWVRSAPRSEERVVRSVGSRTPWLFLPPLRSRTGLPTSSGSMPITRPATTAVVSGALKVLLCLLLATSGIPRSLNPQTTESAPGYPLSRWSSQTVGTSPLMPCQRSARRSGKLSWCRGRLRTEEPRQRRLSLGLLPQLSDRGLPRAETSRSGWTGTELKWLIPGRLGVYESSGWVYSRWSSGWVILGVLGFDLCYGLCCSYAKGGSGSYLEIL